jgi:hypothetical protein
MNKYIFISDLEGGEKKGRFNGAEQNTTMCDLQFYQDLDKMLETENKTHICFLGDYFDMGPGVMNTIIGIGYLKSKYSDRIHILLGNRDINKFRIPYEIQYKFDSENTQTKMKKCGYANGFKRTTENGTENVKEMSADEMILWMNATMGIEKDTCDENNKQCRHGLYIDDMFDPKTKPDAKHNAKQLLLDAFSPTNFIDKRRIDDITTITKANKPQLFKDGINIVYKNAKLAELIDNDLLISHSGGYSQNITAGIPVADGYTQGDDLAYFTDLSSYRELLKNAYADANAELTDIVDNHNSLYSNFMKAYSGENGTSGAYRYHIQLQAMGLPPFPDAPNKFLSFITPCDHSSGAVSHFQLNIDASKIFPTYSAHGHVNYGLPYPIIYKRGDTVMFACDTSVGNRPKNKPFIMNMLEKGVTVKYGHVEYTPSKFTYKYFEPKSLPKDNDITDLYKYINDNFKEYGSEVEYIFKTFPVKNFTKFLEPVYLTPEPIGGKRRTRKNRKTRKKTARKYKKNARSARRNRRRISRKS